jgi:hypothetical protein
MDATVAAGTTVTAYVKGKMSLDPAEFTASGPPPAAAPQVALPAAVLSGLSVIALQNQSGTDAVVRLMGPSAQELTVVDGQSFGANVAAGDYYVLVRYGKSPAEYLFSKTGPVTVIETSGQHSVVRITLHRPVRDNPEAREEFEKGQ